MAKRQTWREALLTGIRDIIFGLQDGLVSTVGVLTGIAAGTNDRFVAILSGFVLVMVEALSMGVGSFLSAGAERGVTLKKYDEIKALVKNDPGYATDILAKIYKRLKLDNLTLKRVLANPKLVAEELAVHHYNISLETDNHVIRNAFYMFFAYILGGAVPILPYFFLAVDTAIVVSVLATVTVLFIIGLIKGKATKSNMLRSGLEMAILSFAATLFGFVVSRLVSLWFGISVVGL